MTDLCDDCDMPACHTAGECKFRKRPAMTDTTKPVADRELFEKLADRWAVHFRRSANGEYENQVTEAFWQLFQDYVAALSTQGQPVGGCCAGSRDECCKDGCAASQQPVAATGDVFTRRDMIDFANWSWSKWYPNADNSKLEAFRAAQRTAQAEGGKE